MIVTIRYVCLILLTGAAGLASGCFWLVPNGLMCASMSLSLLGAVPFAFLWIVVTAWFDPEWSADGA